MSYYIRLTSEDEVLDLCLGGHGKDFKHEKHEQSLASHSNTNSQMVGRMPIGSGYFDWAKTMVPLKEPEVKPVARLARL